MWQVAELLRGQVLRFQAVEHQAEGEGFLFLPYLSLALPRSSPSTAVHLLHRHITCSHSRRLTRSSRASSSSFSLSPLVFLLPSHPLSPLLLPPPSTSLRPLHHHTPCHRWTRVQDRLVPCFPSLPLSLPSPPFSVTAPPAPPNVMHPRTTTGGQGLQDRHAALSLSLLVSQNLPSSFPLHT